MHDTAAQMLADDAEDARLAAIPAPVALGESTLSECYWLARGGDGSSDVIVEVWIVSRRILTRQIDRKWMADGIRPEDAEFAAEIMALPVRDDGMVDVTSVAGQMRDWIIEERPDLEIDGEDDAPQEPDPDAAWNRPLSADDFVAIERAYEATPPERRAKTLETLRTYGTTKAVVDWAIEKSERLERDIDDGFQPFVVGWR